ncbi:MAG TPA: c-type cytochrome [Vicinamibacterales bacterium]|nr:c-type cytochrome [Vicinamibacterales bacterium]
MFVKSSSLTSVRRALRPLAASAMLVFVAFAGLFAQRGELNWTSYGGSADSSRYFDSKKITKANVGKLEAAWSYPYGEANFHPLIVHNVIYARGRAGALIALDAKTGRELWIHDGMTGMTPRGMNYWESKDGKDRRLIFAMNDYLQEIDAITGKSITTFGNGGGVDLREGLGRDPNTFRIQSQTPGQVFENLILLGSATGEGYMSPPGDLRAYDVITGKLAWQFHTVPHPGEFGYETWPKDAWKYIGGVNTWGELTIDEKRGIAYFPTGSPTYDYYGADRPGANLFSDCLIALDARTGKRLWHFQTTHHDLWDFDNNAAPQLTTIKKDGKNIDVVAQAGKTGFLYVFDRVTGTPIWPIEERPVPQSTMPGEQSWPTQPFPTQPPPFAKQSFSVDDINPYANVTPEAREAFKARLAKANNLGMFTPISLVDTLHVPGNNGGALFGTTAAEPNTGIVYVVAQNNPALLKLLPPGAARGGGPPTLPGQALYMRECASCHGADRAGTNTAPTLLTLTGRMDAVAIKDLLAQGRNRMPAFPHINDTEVDQIVAFLLAPARGGGPGAAGRGRGGFPAPPPPPGLVVGSGGPVTRPDSGAGRGRGAAPTYPEGVEPNTQYVIDSYGTIGTMMKPPYTLITAYDLNKPAIKWQVGFGDDPKLAAAGMTGTGITQMRNSIIVTSSGLLFGIGGDGKVRAYDTADGKVLWTSTQGGDGALRSSPALYEVDGQEYMLSPLPADGAVVYVSFALPKK